MNAQFIQHFAQASPPDLPYFRLAFGASSPALARFPAQRVRITLSDAALGWNVALTSRDQLPPFPWPASVVRAHAFRHANNRDADIEMARWLNCPAAQMHRDLLRAVLICNDLSLEQQAERCRVEPGVLRDFEALSWNVKDRCRERLYLAELCQMPGFCQTGEEYPRGYAAMRLLRIAFRTGNTEMVLEAAQVGRIWQRDQRASGAPLEHQLLAQLMGQVATRLRAGYISKDENPLLEEALKMIARQRQNQRERADEKQGLSAAQAIRLSVEGLVEASTENEATR